MSKLKKFQQAWRSRKSLFCALKASALSSCWGQIELEGPNPTSKGNFQHDDKSRVSSWHQNLNRPSLLHDEGDVRESVIYQVWEVIEKGSLPSKRKNFPFWRDEGGKRATLLPGVETDMNEEGRVCPLPGVNENGRGFTLVWKWRRTRTDGGLPCWIPSSKREVIVPVGGFLLSGS